MHIRRFRFLPRFDVLTGRVMPSTDALGLAVLPGADLASDGSSGATYPGDPGPGSGGSNPDASATDGALGSMYDDESPGDGSLYDPSIDPMAPGGPTSVDLTDATPTSPAGAFD
jgi:hypothetical protein